jgi:hypothetical protein
MKAIIFTSIFMLISPAAQAMSHATAADLAGAKEEAMAELKDLKKEFYITIRERVASETEAVGKPADEDGSALLAGTGAGAAEIETLPGAEVAQPWILAAPDATLDVLDREDVGAFETAQLVPLNRASN